MYLSEDKTLRLTTLCGLYVAQGIPWGFVTVTFAAWLADRGVTKDQLGPIIAVATLPWSFKFFWGLMMDRFTLPSFGRRRPWIIFAQSMAIIVLGSMIFFDDLPSLLWIEPPEVNFSLLIVYHLVPGPLAALILLANIFVSMQDVAVDAMAVDLLEEKERGTANGLMYGCSYLGTAIGGAGLGLIVEHFGIQAGLAMQAAFLAGFMMLPVFFRERPPHIDDETSSEISSDPPTDIAEANVAPTTGDESKSAFRNLVTAFSIAPTALAAVVAIMVKIGIAILSVVFITYLIRERGWAKVDYTNLMGGWAMAAGLTGAAIGGFLSDRFGARRLIVVDSAVLGVVWIAMGIVPGTLASKGIVIGMLLGQEFLFAVLSAALFSMFMSVSWRRVSATQFTTFMALMNLSTTIGSYMAGIIDPSVAMESILIGAGILQIVAVLPVLLINPAKTRELLGAE